ncbi:MAG: hypothetical protein [Olavius algarvensis Gamma 1 endosymbiont]|nr:MAG: hypothetical protein [Olavius algarvensis Gamma 1 endosymbiont]
MLDIMHLGEEERSAYEWHIEEMRYQLSMDRSRFMDGHMEGEKKGMERGMEKGKKEGRIEAARIMKQAGEPMEKIMHYTQLTQKELEAL